MAKVLYCSTLKVTDLILASVVVVNWCKIQTHLCTYIYVHVEEPRVVKAMFLHSGVLLAYCGGNRQFTTALKVKGVLSLYIVSSNIDAQTGKVTKKLERRLRTRRM